MKLPPHLLNSSQWTLIGPMGPQVPEHLLSHALLGVDGGSDFAKRLDIWVGDSDSGTKKTDCQYAFEFSSKKSSSDLNLALSLLSPLAKLTLHLWGFHGGRLDHEMINFGETSAFMETHPGSQAILYNHQGEVVAKILGQGKWSFERQGLFTVLSLRETQVIIDGECEYPLRVPTTFKPVSSLGLSNVARGTVLIHNSGPVILIFPVAP